MLNTIKKLTSAYGVSGEEDEIREIIISEIQDIVDELWIDNVGNLIVRKKGTNSINKIMLTTNMDTIGVMITHIMNNGLLKFIIIGAQHKLNLYGQYVIFKNKIKGIIIAEKSTEHNGFSGELYIDIGSICKDGTEAVINIGDTAMFYSECRLMKNKVVSNFLSNRSVCSIFIHILKEIKQINSDIYFIFAAQGINGLKSINVPVLQIKPQVIIRINSSVEAISNEINCTIDKGCILNRIDSEMFCHPKLCDILKELALKNNINLHERFDNKRMLNKNIENMSFNGIISASISIPCQNIGSSFEMMSMNDIQNTKQLLEYFILNYYDEISSI